MRVCLDECVDRRLARHVTDHEVKTVAGMDWRGLSNGELLTRVAAEFDVFITTDRNLSFQQNLVGHDVAVIVMRARSNRLDDQEAVLVVVRTSSKIAPSRSRL